MRITEKRATVWNEWLLSRLGNNEDYYYSTLYTGIPDGSGKLETLEDLQECFYDDDLDDMIEMYQRIRKRYQKDGFYFNKKVHTLDETIDYIKSLGLWKEKIYKGSNN